MKKTGIIIGLLLLIGVGFLGYKGYEYYNNRYVGEDYYAQVPETPQPIVPVHDAAGKEFGKGVIYNLTGYNADGTTREFEVTIVTEGEYKDGEPYTPGTYLKLSASKQIIVNTTQITKSEIPSSIQQYFD